MNKTKVCSKCGKSLPATREYFTLFKHAKDGFCSSCKKCRGFKGYGLTIGGINTELAKQGLKKCPYCLEVKPLSEYKPVGKTRLSEFCDDCEEIHRGHKREYDQAHYEVIKDSRKKYYNDWKKNGGQEIRKLNHRKRASIKKGLAHSFTAGEWDYCKNAFDNRCAYCGRRIDLTQDHFIPISRGGEYTINNIIPACMECNNNKKTRDFFKWYPKYRFYSVLRERRILRYLNYQNQNQQQLGLF